MTQPFECQETRDVHGRRIDDAIQATGIAIASMKFLAALLVIHGIGTGALKQSGIEYISNTSKSFQL